MADLRATLSDCVEALEDALEWLESEPKAGNLRGQIDAALAAARAALEAQATSAPAPVDMVLHCPACGMQHIDAPEANDKYLALSDPPAAWSMPPWKNAPHRSHLCHGCGHIWRPADVPTNGVNTVKTKGKNDSPVIAAPQAPSAPQPATVPSQQCLYPSCTRGVVVGCSGPCARAEGGER